MLLLVLAVILPANCVWSQPPNFTEEEAAYQQALQYIEQHRKNNVTITVSDLAGRPLRNANVSYMQTSHDFVFGVFGNGWGIPNEDDAAGWRLYCDLVTKINATIVMTTWYFWAYTEPERGKFVWYSADMQFQRIWNHCPASRFIIVFANLNQEREQTPGWVGINRLNNETFFAEFKQDLYDYVSHVVKKYASRVDYWVTEAELNLNTAMAFLWRNITKGIEIDLIEAHAIRDADPDARILLMPGYITKGGEPAHEFAKRFLALDVNIDGFSIETYPDDYGGAYKHTPIFYKQVINELQALGKPVFIMETGYPSQPCVPCDEKGGWIPWSRDEPTQAAWVKYMTGISYGTEGVIGITYYPVDILDPSGAVQAFTNFGLLTRQGRAKQAYWTCLEQIQMFTTSGSETTDAQGRLSFRGFAGNYVITVTTAYGQKSETHIHVQQLSNSTYAEQQDFSITLAPQPIINSTSAITSRTTTASSQAVQIATAAIDVRPAILLGAIAVVGIAAAVSLAIQRKRRKR